MPQKANNANTHHIGFGVSERTERYLIDISIWMDRYDDVRDQFLGIFLIIDQITGFQKDIEREVVWKLLCMPYPALLPHTCVLLWQFPMFLYPNNFPFPSFLTPHSLSIYIKAELYIPLLKTSPFLPSL